MSAEITPEIPLEIGHVLFMDIVGCSKLLITEQSEQIQKLTEIVRSTEQFRIAQGEGKLLSLPTGDGAALVFRTNPEAPAPCALEISKALKKYPELRVRMGIHSGPVNEIIDINGQPNIAGAGINVAQRVMDCGDAGHILLSKHVAEDLEEYPRWRPLLRDLGECEVKHGVRIGIVNLCVEYDGNPEAPQKLREASKLFSIVYWSFEPRQTTPEGQAPFFKRKIRVVLRNDTDKEIKVETPDWAADAGDLAIQPSGRVMGAASKIRLENKQSGGWQRNQWLREADQLIALPGDHFETWVGLSHQYTEQGLELHSRAAQIGTLVFLVTIDGQKRQFRIRVT
jgi:hypothetical protein